VQLYERGYAPRKFFFGNAEWDRNRKRKKRLLLFLVVRWSPVVVWVQSWLYVGVIVGFGSAGPLLGPGFRVGKGWLACGAGQEGSTAEASCQSSQKYAPLTSPAGKSRAHFLPSTLLKPSLHPPPPSLPPVQRTVVFCRAGLPMDLPSDLTVTLNCRGGSGGSTRPQPPPSPICAFSLSRSRVHTFACKREPRFATKLA
jgi:hypothetical protein